MKSVLDLLALRLPLLRDELQRQLQERYAIKELQIEIKSGHFTYNLQSMDEVNGFVCSWGNTWAEAQQVLLRQLTSNSELGKIKRAKAQRLIAEADQLPKL